MKKKYYSISLMPLNNRLLLTLNDLSKEYQFNLVKDGASGDIAQFLTDVSYSYFKYNHITRCVNHFSKEPRFEEVLWRYLTIANPNIDFVSPRYMLDEEGYTITKPPLVNVITQNVIAALSEASSKYILSPLGYVDDIQWLEWSVEFTGKTTILLVCHGDYRIRRYHELLKDGTITQ